MKDFSVVVAVMTIVRIDVLQLVVVDKAVGFAAVVERFVPFATAPVPWYRGAWHKTKCLFSVSCWTSGCCCGGCCNSDGWCHDSPY